MLNYSVVEKSLSENSEGCPNPDLTEGNGENGERNLCRYGLSLLAELGWVGDDVTHSCRCGLLSDAAPQL